MEVRKVTVSVLGGADVAFAMKGGIVQVTWHGRTEALLVGCPGSEAEVARLQEELVELYNAVLKPSQEFELDNLKKGGE